MPEINRITAAQVLTDHVLELQFADGFPGNSTLHPLFGDLYSRR